VADAGERYEVIKKDYKSLLDTAKLISTSETPSLYRVLSGVSSQQQLITKRDLLFLALAIVLGGMFAVIGALIWPSREQREAHH
jgi:uncharacterized protein involved in exopolysaccharide biosynthesis